MPVDSPHRDELPNSAEAGPTAIARRLLTLFLALYGALDLFDRAYGLLRGGPAHPWWINLTFAGLVTVGAAWMGRTRSDPEFGRVSDR